MDDPLILTGFRHSVYTWIVRLALAEMGLEATYVEANPFAKTPDPVLGQVTPFGRVPVVQHGDFTLTETSAILRYLDRLSKNPSMIPTNAKAAARMDQVIGIVDAYAYPTLVRQVFSNGYYLHHVEGGRPDEPVVRDGLARAKASLGIFDDIAREGRQLTGDCLSLADIHLAPMISYFARVPEGAAMLASYPALQDWWAILSAHPSVTATDPFAGT